MQSSWLLLVAFGLFWALVIRAAIMRTPLYHRDISGYIASEWHRFTPIGKCASWLFLLVLALATLFALADAFGAPLSALWDRVGLMDYIDRMGQTAD